LRFHAKLCLMPDYRERRFAARDGLVLYAREYGDALAPRLPLLCLSGLTRNSADFDRVARRLSHQRRVLCPDYRGRGRSAYDPHWRNYEARVLIDDVAQLLAVAGVERAVVLGTSLGGILAMGLAVAKPLAVAGAILNDVGPAVEASGLANIVQYIADDHPQPDWPTATRFLRQSLPQLMLATDEDWAEFARGTYREGSDGVLHFDWDVTGLARQLKAGAVPDLWPLYRALARVPILALRGAASDILSAATLDDMAREKPDLVRVAVPRVGHAPCLDEAEAKEAIDAFLEQF
jgi:pimeloyl-ACP methyl ester carboxylesterase